MTFMSVSAWQFVDTNVLICAYNPSDGAKHQQALALIESLWRTGRGCVSNQVLQEFYVTITRKVRDRLSEELAYIRVVELAAWHVYSPGRGDVLGAIQLHLRYGISYWDALILRSASRLGCDIVWSEDLNAGQKYGDVTVLNPFKVNQSQ